MADAGDSTEDSAAVPEAAMCARRSAKEENKHRPAAQDCMLRGTAEGAPGWGDLLANVNGEPLLTSVCCRDSYFPSKPLAEELEH